MKNLIERRDRIIETVVARHLESAEPVSSADVCDLCGLGLSPATIRSIMHELEEEGFLTQPHTSAGRVPTVKCYRYYVRCLMPSVEVDETEIDAVRRLVEDVVRENDADLFLRHVASSLSEVTDLIGVVVSPSFEHGVFDRIEIVPLGGSRYLIVVSLKSGFVKTVSITVDKVIARRKVEETARLLNTRLAGLTVSEIRTSIADRIGDSSEGDRRLLDIILDRSRIVFSFPLDRNVHVSGLPRLLAHPDFITADRSLDIAGLIEQRDELADAVNTVSAENGVGIRIGGTGLWGRRPPLALVAASFPASDGFGTLAVIGPARVYYPRLTAIVRYAASMTAGFFSS